MKAFFLFCFLILHTGIADMPPLKMVRMLYGQSGTDKDAAKKFLTALEPVDSNAAPVLEGYKGAAEMMRAKYAANPLTKFAAFKIGKGLIEHAIKRDSMGMELRFIRYSIQSNLPEMLGYRSSITADKMLILDKVTSEPDTGLKKMVINYMSVSKFCTEEELKKIKKSE